MNDNEGEVFFVSDVLKDILDKDALAENFMDSQVKSENEIEILGKFVDLSMKDSLMTLEVTPAMARILLFNDEKTYIFSFMNEVWKLNSLGMKLKQCENSKFKATICIVGRK